MPRVAKTEEEKMLEKQVADLIRSVRGNEKPAVDVNRAITLFERAQGNITQALAILRGEELEIDPNTKRPGRPKKSVDAGSEASGATTERKKPGRKKATPESQEGTENA